MLRSPAPDAVRPTLCPECKKARMRVETKSENHTERLCDADHAPDVVYPVVTTEHVCPRCPYRTPATSDHQKARSTALRNFWLRFVHGAGYTWQDVLRIRQIAAKVCEDGTLEPEWFAEWLIKGE